MRRNIVRYAMLSYVITLQKVSFRVKKRFPTWQHMVDAGEYNSAFGIRLWMAILQGVMFVRRWKQPTTCNKFRLLIYLNQLYRFRATNSPILMLLPTGDKVCTGRQQYRCIVPKAVLTVKKCCWGWASLSPETYRADLKRSINGICWTLLVAYIVVLMMHCLTNIKFKCYVFFYFFIFASQIRYARQTRYCLNLLCIMFNK